MQNNSIADLQELRQHLDNAVVAMQNAQQPQQHRSLPPLRPIPSSQRTARGPSDATAFKPPERHHKRVSEASADLFGVSVEATAEAGTKTARASAAAKAEAEVELNDPKTEAKEEEEPFGDASVSAAPPATALPPWRKPKVEPKEESKSDVAGEQEEQLLLEDEDDEDLVLQVDEAELMELLV